MMKNNNLTRANETEILNQLKQVDAVLKGHFILSSGLHSDTYIQCAKALMKPELSKKLCANLTAKILEKININEIDLVVAPAMGGVVVGYEMGCQLNKPTIFCERENGQFTFRRGFDFKKGSKILLVEDVVTTGKSSIEAIKCIESFGGEVVLEASLIQRNNGGDNLPIELISLLNIQAQTFSKDNIPDNLKSIDPIKPGSRWLK